MQQNNILFIDDNTGVLEALEVIFADEPYECLTCQEPEQAMSLMEESDFAVVISDQRMEGLEGTDLLEKIKNKWPQTNRILMTAYQEMNIMLDAINKGQVYNLIFKPWDENQLKQVIKNAVEDYTLKIVSGSKRALDNPVNSNIHDLIKKNHQLEMEKQLLMDRLQHAQKMATLGNLATGIGHDFNNTLQIINGCLQLSMIDSSLTPSVEARLRQALQASSRAKDLISQIFAFNNTNANKGKPIKLSLLLDDIIRFIQAAFSSSVEIRKNITIHSGMVQLAPIKVYQILINLCTNAVNAMSGCNGIIDIGLAKTQIDKPAQTGQMKVPPGTYFCLTARDNGDGIDAANLKKIFDPYFTTRKKAGGTGLGLTLINQIVQDHGGQITVESEVGKGSAFHVYLPLIEEVPGW